MLVEFWLSMRWQFVSHWQDVKPNVTSHWLALYNREQGRNEVSRFKCPRQARDNWDMQHFEQPEHASEMCFYQPDQIQVKFVWISAEMTRAYLFPLNCRASENQVLVQSICELWLWVNPRMDLKKYFTWIFGDISLLTIDQVLVTNRLIDTQPLKHNLSR